MKLQVDNRTNVLYISHIEQMFDITRYSTLFFREEIVVDIMKDKIVGIAYDYSAKNNKERRAKEKEVKSFIKIVEKNYLNKKPLEKKQRERSG